MKILNFDKEKELVNKDSLSYGFGEGADVRATDINMDEKGINFKVRYKGNTVPFWAKGVFNNESIYAVLELISQAILQGRNLVEISNSIKNKSSL